MIDIPQLEAMRHGIDYKFKITCRNFEVFVRPLSALEVVQAASEAAEHFQKLTEVQKISITMSLLMATCQLEKASSPDIGEFPTLTRKMLEMMTPDEINHLWKQYVRVCDRVNPSFENMGADELSNTVEALKKSSDRLSLLTDLSISQLITVCLHLLEV